MSGSYGRTNLIKGLQHSEHTYACMATNLAVGQTLAMQDYDLPKVITERKSSEGRKESSCPNVPVHHLLVTSSDDIQCDLI